MESLHGLADSYYLTLPPGPPSQGDLWMNLPIGHQDPPYGHGILITPSCDFAHDKAPQINYVAAISLDTYMKRFGGFTLLEEELLRITNALKNSPPHPKVAGLGDIGVSPERILKEVEGDETLRATAIPKRLADFQQGIEKTRQIRLMLTKEVINSADLGSLLPEKSIRAYKEKIVRNQIVDLHFLPPYLPTLPEPCVLQLRCISTCSIEFLRLAHACGTDVAWQQELERGAHFELRNAPNRPERLLRLRPPYLQVLMARIGALFGRVGVPDLPASTVKSFVE